MMELLDRAAGSDLDAVAPREAVHRVEIEVSHRTPDRTFYRVWFRGEVLVVHWDPEYAACRKLRDMGVTGTLRTRQKGAAHDAIVMDIERTAEFCTRESRTDGPVNVKFVPFTGIAPKARE